jgi:hypothetical protein
VLYWAIRQLKTESASPSSAVAGLVLSAKKYGGDQTNITQQSYTMWIYWDDNPNCLLFAMGKRQQPASSQMFAPSVCKRFFPEKGDFKHQPLKT